jgi:hypothetical protein
MRLILRKLQDITVQFLEILNKRSTSVEIRSKKGIFVAPT